MNDGGYSTCPICKRYWRITMFDDCMLPACGCYGSDVSVKNPNRICESCGMKHVHSCPKMNEEKPMLKSQNSRFVLVFVSFFVITISIGGYFANKNGAFGFYSLLWTGILVAFILMISVSSWIGRGD